MNNTNQEKSRLVLFFLLIIYYLSLFNNFASSDTDYSSFCNNGSSIFNLSKLLFKIFCHNLKSIYYLLNQYYE